MGNHDVGRGMAAAAKTFWIATKGQEVSRELALEALDAMAEDYRGADAEFDDELLEETDLSRLVLSAFGATDRARKYLTGDDLSEDAEADWDVTYEQFRSRYEFC